MCGTAKLVLKGKFIVLNTFLRKERVEFNGVIFNSVRRKGATKQISGYVKEGYNKNERTNL